MHDHCRCSQCFEELRRKLKRAEARDEVHARHLMDAREALGYRSVPWRTVGDIIRDLRRELDEAKHEEGLKNERLQQTIEHLEEQLRGFRSMTWFGAACMGNAIRIRCVADGWSKELLIPNPAPPYSFRLPWCGGVKDFRCTHKVVEGHVLYEAR